MPIKFCSETYFFQARGLLTSLKCQNRDLQLKVPPGELVLRFLRPEKIHRLQPGLNAWTLDLETNEADYFMGNSVAFARVLVPRILYLPNQQRSGMKYNEFLNWHKNVPSRTFRLPTSRYLNYCSEDTNVIVSSFKCLFHVDSLSQQVKEETFQLLLNGFRFPPRKANNSQNSTALYTLPTLRCRVTRSEANFHLLPDLTAVPQQKYRLALEFNLRFHYKNLNNIQREEDIIRVSIDIRCSVNWCLISLGPFEKVVFIWF